MSNRNRFFYQ